MTLVSILKVFGIGLNTALACPLIVGVATFDKRLAYRVSQLWVRVNLLISGVQVHVRYETALDPHRPYVFMSNHQSHFDVLAVVAALPEFQLRWVAKKELTRVPIFGWALQHTDHIIIDRSNHLQAMASLRAAQEQMQRGCSVIIFPEGTRGLGDGLLPFKKGGFVLAEETGIPIVPIVVRGSRRILPAHAWRIAAGDVEVDVGRPIATAGVDRESVMQAVRDWFEAHLKDPAAAQQATLAEAG